LPLALIGAGLLPARASGVRATKLLVECVRFAAAKIARGTGGILPPWFLRGVRGYGGGAVVAGVFLVARLVGFWRFTARPSKAAGPPARERSAVPCLSVARSGESPIGRVPTATPTAPATASAPDAP